MYNEIRSFSAVTFKADSHIACRSRAAPMPSRQGFRMCLSHLIYTVRPCLIHTCHAAPMPCYHHAVLLKAMAQCRRDGLWAASLRLLPATTQSSTKIVIRSVRISDAGGQYETQRSSWTKKSLLFWCKDVSACIICNTKIMITI
jgi:hypothetical protein